MFGELQKRPKIERFTFVYCHSRQTAVEFRTNTKEIQKTERGNELQNKFAASLKQTNIVFEQINIVFLYYVIIIQ
jgi:hypothetical protein